MSYRMTVFLVLILLLVGCSSGNAIVQDLEAPTEKPDSTDAPTEEPTMAVPPTPTFDRNAMLTDITTNVLVPAYINFEQEAAALEEVIVAFAGTPSQETLDGAQAQWLVTFDAWNRCAYGRLTFDLRVMHGRINQYPVRDTFIEETIAGDVEITPELIAGSGSTSQGLSALEYLLFVPNGDDALILNSLADPRRMAYLTTTAVVLHTHAEELVTHWHADGENYAEVFITAADDNDNLQMSIDMLTNQMINRVENNTQRTLGNPLGFNSGGEPQPDLVTNYRSGADIAGLIAELETFKLVFTGEDGIGYDDYLLSFKREELATDILAQADETIAALNAIDQPMQMSLAENPEQVEAAYNAYAELVRLTKVDLANQLGVTVTFNDSDGD